MLVAVASVPASAQEVNDTEVWLDAEGVAELVKRLELSIQQELRLGQEAGFDQTHTDVELHYWFDKHFGAGAHYRYILLDDDRLDRTETRHRLSGDFDARIRPGLATLSYRARLQATTRENDDTLTVLRHRFKAAVEIEKLSLSPFAALELFHSLSPVQEFRERRVYLGLSWKGIDRLQLAAYVLFLDESNVMMPASYTVFGLGASYTFRQVGGRGEDEQPGQAPAHDVPTAD